MFSEGGLNQEGGMVDEVSGNEVPMGSTREEVRDDIPAQVSEGEFIFPADVVRFIGLNQLMQMRQDAKMGLKKMDAMGQMGNSDEATMPDDMPFGIADLVVIDGPDEEEPQKKYKGGLSFANGGISMPDFDRSSQDVRIYVKEGSPDRRVPFFNGEPVISIENLLAQGYVLKGSEPVEETKTETEEAIPTRKSSDRTPMKKTPFQEAGGWGMELGDPPDPAKVKLWTDEYAKTSGNTPAVLTGIATVLGGPLGALVHMANKGNAKSAAANYERVLKAAQQTNVAGQVKALQDINKAVKEGGDKSLLGKIVDGLKNTFGLSDEQADKAKTTAVKADIKPTPLVETDEQKTARLEAREGARGFTPTNEVTKPTQTARGFTPDSETEEAIPFDAEGVVANERDFESKGTSPVRLMGDSETEEAISTPQTIKQVAAELDIDFGFDFENVVAKERNFEEMFKQASQGTIEVNANTVKDLRSRLLSDAEIEANNTAAIQNINNTAADLVNETALSNREKTSERSGQLSAEELMSPDKSPTSSDSGRSSSSSGPRKPSLAQRMQKTRKAGQAAQKSLDKYKDSDEAKKIAQTGSQEQIKALERTSDVIRDMQRGVQRGFKKGGLASRRK